jgi:hypothetical protein
VSWRRDRLTVENLPASRSDGLLVERVGAETVVYDSDSREAHCLSPLAAAVFAACDGRTTIAQLSISVGERLGEDVTTDQVRDALAQLDACDLMESRAPREAGSTRREMIKKTAVTGGAVASVPLIMSVAAPIAHAAQTASCGTPGASNSVLCCPCGTGGPDTGKQSCCTVPNVTENCVCVSAQGNASKFCKPGQNSAVQDQDCLLPPAGNATLTNCCSICAANTTAPTVCNNLCQRVTGASGNCRAVGSAFPLGGVGATCPNCPAACGAGQDTACNPGVTPP